MPGCLKRRFYGTCLRKRRCHSKQGRINCGHSQVREATTGSNWLQSCCHQGDTSQRTWDKAQAQPLAFSGLLVLWFNSLQGMEKTRDHHHHMSKGYYGNNRTVKNQLEFRLYTVLSPACACFLVKGLRHVQRHLKHV